MTGCFFNLVGDGFGLPIGIISVPVNLGHISPAAIQKPERYIQVAPFFIGHAANEPVLAITLLSGNVVTYSPSSPLSMRVSSQSAGTSMMN